MKSNLFVLLFLFVFLGLSHVALAEDYVEPGRFGIEGTITTGGFQAGVVRETDTCEAALDLKGSTSTTSSIATGALGVELRAGKRVNLGTFNYLSFGVDAATSILSVTNGVSTNGSYRIGPYMGLQRHFSGTNLMLSIYVLPYQYSYTPSFQSRGSTITNQFFHTGGFGIAYLF